jgi:hypothetical protein
MRIDIGEYHSDIKLVKRQAPPATHGKIAFDLHPGVPTSKQPGALVQIGNLFLQTVFGRSLQAMSVGSAAKMSDEDNALQFVNSDEEIELLARGLGQGQPRRPARHCPAIVARNLQAFVAEIVEGLSPAAIAAVQSQGADAFVMPWLGAGENGNGKIGSQPEGVLAKVGWENCRRQC